MSYMKFDKHGLPKKLKEIKYYLITYKYDTGPSEQVIHLYRTLLLMKMGIFTYMRTNNVLKFYIYQNLTLN